jgi:hypothetical protein
LIGTTTGLMGTKTGEMKTVCQYFWEIMSLESGMIWNAPATPGFPTFAVNGIQLMVNNLECRITFLQE